MKVKIYTSINSPKGLERQFNKDFHDSVDITIESVINISITVNDCNINGIMTAEYILCVLYEVSH